MIEARSRDSAVEAAAFDQLSAAAAVLDETGVILATNRAWRLFGQLNDADAATTGPGVNYLDVCDRSAASGSIDASLVAIGLRQIMLGERRHFDLEYACPSGAEDRWYLLQASAAPVSDGAGIVVFHLDITARTMVTSRLSALSDDDEQTGLPNRRSAVAHLEQQLVVARETGSQVGLLFVTVQNLGAETRLRGPHVAAELMVKVGLRARRCIRVTDRLCRFGPNDFVAVCPGLDSTSGALMAARLQAALDESFQVGDLEVAAQTSVEFTNTTIDSTVGSLLSSTGRSAGMALGRPVAVVSHRSTPEYQATHDWLTQLPNSARLGEYLHEYMVDRRALIAIAIVDIDQFKMVNDVFGNEIGDGVLRAIATRLRTGLRHRDVVARVGGDEFALVRAGIDSLEHARELADEAMALLREPFDVRGTSRTLQFSIGVTMSERTDSPASVLRDADDAMYESKRDGKHRITAFDHNSRARARRRQCIANSLSGALDRNEMYLEYQPIVDLRTSAVAGFEALLRWRHPALGVVAPTEFVPIAEATGQILAIGDWVIDQSMQQLANWRFDARVSTELWMALNVSVTQLARPGLAEHVTRAAHRARVPAAAIHLEITESTLMDNVEIALTTIAELQASGVNVSIDDFGTGYSSLSYLSRLPIDTIKIDRSFVTGLSVAGHGRSIVRAMIGLADTLGLEVVAEGIEHTAQLEQLSELGCTFGQGFFWSPALPPAAALDFLLQRSTSDAKVTRARPPAGGDRVAAPESEVGDADIEIARPARPQPTE